MTPLRPFVALGLVCALGACGAPGGGGTAEQALNYTPVYAAGPGDTTLAAISGAGLTGVMSQANFGISSVNTELKSAKVRLSADGNTAFLTVDGVTQSFPVVIKTVGGGQFGNVPTQVLQITATDGTFNLFTYSGSSGVSGFGAFGYVGIETPVSELPAASATYSGFWGGQAYNPGNTFADSGVVGGELTITANFGSGAVDGSFTGSLNAADVGDFAGVVSGNAVGNGVLGSMEITSGDFSGSMPIAAKTYGYDAADLAGGFAGSIQSTVSGKTYATTGTFALD